MIKKPYLCIFCYIESSKFPPKENLLLVQACLNISKKMFDIKEI